MGGGKRREWFSNRRATTFLTCFSCSKLVYRVSAGAGEEEIKAIRGNAIHRMYAKGSMAETCEMLAYAGKPIQLLFSKILSDPHAYPILISGGDSLRDANTLLLMVLLLVEVPFEHIEVDLLSSFLDADARPWAPWPDVKPEVRNEIISEIKTNRGDWADVLKRHLDQKYGGSEGYLAQTGVTWPMRDAVRRSLMASANEKLIEY